MARMSDIVGGILRDLSQSHAVADAHTRDVLESYARDPLLSQLPVPRLTIRQATLKLKFAVRDLTPAKGDDDMSDYQAIWGKALRERILPMVMERVGKLDNRAVVNTLAGRLSRPEVDASVTAARLLDAALHKELEQETAELFLREVQGLPKSVHRYLPDRELLQNAVQTVVALELPEVQRAAQRLQQARSVALSDLDVSVSAEELRQLPESQVSELELVLNMEELQREGG